MENQPDKESKKELIKFEDLVKIIVVICIFLVALSVAYYLVIYIPKRDKAKIEQQNQQAQQQAQQKQTNADNLTNCLSSENEARNRNMQRLVDQSKKVKLPIGQDSLDTVEKVYQERKADCFKKYPQ